MRKHDVRKWLHAALDLLPVILIPVFMIYSHRHDVTENVEINYKYESNEVNTLDDLIIGNLYHINFDNNTIDSFVSINDVLTLNFINISSYDFTNYEWYLDEIDRFMAEPNGYITAQLTIYSDYSSVLNFYLTYNDQNDYFVSLTYQDLSEEPFTLVGDALLQYGGISLFYTDCITYTDYNVIESVDVTNSNVMDSFMNNFNNTIDKHFNMGNVFNLGGVYQWFNTNIFNGNAPTIIYSIWNIALYELVMDLLFLLYGLFMWFIDMVEHIMNKPFKSIK